MVVTSTRVLLVVIATSILASCGFINNNLIPSTEYCSEVYYHRVYNKADIQAHCTIPGVEDAQGIRK